MIIKNITIENFRSYYRRRQYAQGGYQIYIQEKKLRTD